MYGKFWQRIVKSLHAHTHTHTSAFAYFTQTYLCKFMHIITGTMTMSNDKYIYIHIFVDYDGMYTYICIISLMYVYIHILICKKHWCIMYKFVPPQTLPPPLPFSCFCLDFPRYGEIAVWRPYDNPYDVGMYRNICAVLGSSPLVWYLDTLNKRRICKGGTPPEV